MRFLRPILLSLAIVLGLAALIVASAFLPAVQTLIARRALDQHPALRASLGSLAATTEGLDAQDVTLRVNGATLTLPALHARLPVTAALWKREVNIRSLVAKGWTLDLAGAPERAIRSQAPGSPSATTSAANPSAPPSANATATTAHLLHHLLATWRLPAEVAIDEVELEGDIVLPTPPGRDPVFVHAIVKGGGLGAGRSGSFTVAMTVPPTETTRAFAPLRVNGRLKLVLDAARAPSRLELDADLSASHGALPAGLHAIATWSAATAARAESHTLTLTRDRRRVADFDAHYDPAARQLAGTWKVDVSDADLASFAAQTAWPKMTITGSGRFDADPDFARVHAAGKLDATASQLGAIAGALDRIGTATFSTEFEATRLGESLRFDRCDATLGGDRPVVTARALQAFALAETTGELRPTDPGADWLAITLRDVPLSWIAGNIGGVALSGSGVSGDLRVRAADGTIVVHANAPLLAAAVAVRRGVKILTEGLDWSLPVDAKFARGGWQAKLSPLTIASAGQTLATLAVAASRAPSSKTVKVEAAWTADLVALALQPGLAAALDSLEAKAASGNFTLQADAWTNFDSKFILTGMVPTHTISATLHVNADPEGRFTFYAPVKFALGSSVSEITAEGRATRPGSDGRLTVNLTGDNVVVDHLALLAAPLTATGLLTLPANVVAVVGEPTIIKGPRDAAPFWGRAIGRVSFDFGHVTAGLHHFTDVGGTLFFDRGSMKLEGGRGVFHQDRHVRAQGTLTFDPKAESPYQLKATATSDEIDAALFLGAPPAGQEPLLHGKFAVTAAVTGDGLNLNNLARNTEEEFRLTSINGGSTRLLETNVANVLTEAATPVSDAVGTVGAVFEKLLGAKRNILQAEKKSVSPGTDAVLNFTYVTKEFRYDQFALTAVRTADGTVRLTQFDLTAPNERLNGTGEIAFVQGRALATRPLSLDLRLGLRGAPAKFLTTAGLLAAPADATAYAPLDLPLHFGGTLEQIDRREWREFLVKAVVPPGPAAKTKPD